MAACTRPNALAVFARMHITLPYALSPAAMPETQRTQYGMSCVYIDNVKAHHCGKQSWHGLST
jgi:hypothetical protein